MSENKPCYEFGRFCWNELLAADEPSAQKYYASLFGWTTEAFGGDKNYTLFKKGQSNVGGVMKCPQPGLPSHWLAYVTVEDVDGVARKAKSLGGKVVLDPFDVPTVGRIAVLTDPQGAALGIIKPAA